MRVIETPEFTRRLRALLTDEEYRQLQVALCLRPEQGALVPGGGGLRKIRWAKRGKGKRGGLRILYYWNPTEEIVYMLFIFPKAEREDLTPAQVKALGRLIKEELQ
jgi:mRNA-degrading endonuclease RelE of RelBE toxin-antitoxin system